MLTKEQKDRLRVFVANEMTGPGSDVAGSDHYQDFLDAGYIKQTSSVVLDGRAIFYYGITPTGEAALNEE